MVWIVNKFDFYRMILLILIATLLNCSILRKYKGYELLPERNEIVGCDKNAPALEIKSLYLKTLITYLFGVPRKINSHAFNRGYNRMQNPIFAGFKISGCVDTTKAKLIMANHLMNKYGYIRKDSVFLDTIYRIEIVVPHKLPIQNENCDQVIIAVTKDSSELYSSMNCLEWNSFFINMVNDFCHRQHCYPLAIPEGSGKMYIRKPVLKSVNHDVKGLQAYYEEEFGIRITQERIDSVNVMLIKKLPGVP